jgi:hypothetical protein
MKAIKQDEKMPKYCWDCGLPLTKKLWKEMSKAKKKEAIEMAKKQNLQ